MKPKTEFDLDKQIIKDIIGQGIIDAIGDGLSIQDTNYRIIYQNKKAKAMIGSHVGAYCYRAIERRESICEDCPLSRSFKDGKVHKAIRTNPARGGNLIVEITSSAIRDSAGKIIAGIELVRDITKQKHLENIIFQEKKEWQETFDIINDAITVHDMEFNVIRANKAAGKMLGTKYLDLLKQKCYQSYHGTAAPPENCPSCRALMAGVPTTSEMFEPSLNKHLEIKALPRFDKDKRLIGMVHVVRDITARKKLEDERNDLICDLTEALAEVKTLSGLLPICYSCKRIRDDEGYWQQVDQYIHKYTDAEFTHSLCPDCVEKQFPGLNDEKS